MKTYRYYNDDNSVDVTYITDGTTNTKLNTIVDVKSLNDADVVAGMNLVVGVAYDEEVLKAKATTLNLNLEIVNDITQISNTTWEADILTFSLAEQTGAATIDNDKKTIDIEVASETTVTALVATFTLSSGASATVDDVAQVSATTENDFTSAVEYVVTGAAGKEVTWTVTVTVAEAE